MGKKGKKEKFSFTQFSKSFLFHSRKINCSTDGTVKWSLIASWGLEWYLLTYKQPVTNELKPTGQSLTNNSLNLITNEVSLQIHRLKVRREYIALTLSNQNFQSCSNESSCTSSKMSKLFMSYLRLNLHISALILWILVLFLLHLKLHYFREFLYPQNTFYTEAYYTHISQHISQ